MKYLYGDGFHVWYFTGTHPLTSDSRESLHLLPAVLASIAVHSRYQTQLVFQTRAILYLLLDAPPEKSLQKFSKKMQFIYLFSYSFTSHFKITIEEFDDYSLTKCQYG